MSASFILIKGASPLLISMPHNGQAIPDDIALTMTESAKKVADTEYRILAALIKQLGGSVPATGLPTDQVWSKFIEIVDSYLLKEKI